MNHDKCNLQAAKIILKVNSEIIYVLNLFKVNN